MHIFMPSCRTKVPAIFSAHASYFSSYFHSVLLVIMFIAQDITTKPKNNKPENLVWFFKHLFGQRYLMIS